MLDKLRQLTKKKNDILDHPVTQKLGDMAQKIKEGASSKSRTILQRGLEDRDLLKEAQAIHRECDRLVNNHNSRMNVLERQFEQEVAIFNGTHMRLDDDILPLCYKFFAMSLDVPALSSEAASSINLSQFGLSYMDDVYVDGTVNKAMVAKGLGAGAASAAGLFGAMATFGTASTGTAIAALHGGAVYTATLAALGGGSVAAGGLGMTGGLIVLGASGALPAVAVVGYLADKKIRKSYDEAVQRKIDTEIVMVEADKAYRAVSDMLGNIRTFNSDFRSFADFFADLMNMSIGAVAVSKEADYFSVLQKAMVAARCYKSVHFLSGEAINPDFIAESLNVRAESDRVRSSFYGFFNALTEEQQKTVEKFRREQLRSDKFERKYKSAMQQAQKVKAENKKLAMQHRQDQAMIERLRTIIGDYQKQLEFLRQLIEQQGWDVDDPILWRSMEQISAPLTEKVISSNDAEMQALARHYRQQFKNFDEEVISSLAASDYLYGMLRDQRDMDFSPVLLPAFKAIELLLREALKNHGVSRPERGWLLGAMCKEMEKSPHIWDKDLVDTLEDIRQVRNKTAHPGGIQLFQVENTRVILYQDNIEKPALLRWLDEILE